MTAPQIGVVAGVWLMTSYGFMYEVERGNIDLYALFFALLSVWLMLRLPRSPWWPAIALAISINLKLYPGVLLVLLLWRYRLKAVIPAIVTNVVLLLVGRAGQPSEHVHRASPTSSQTRGRSGGATTRPRRWPTCCTRSQAGPAGVMCRCSPSRC